MAVRDPGTCAHSRRVRQHALTLARRAGVADQAAVEAIGPAALLHDIGKLAIPDRLLQKPGPLTRAEYAIVQQHALIGSDILTAAGFHGAVSLVVRHHHESWNGTGYPDGLRGESIPVVARVLAIVDCYDALVSDRPYRRALPHECAVTMIAEQRSIRFDPVITDLFLRIVERLRIARAREHGQTPERRPAVWPHARAV
jgi:putative nucleotidyltransferase with HDIG domain